MRATFQLSVSKKNLEPWLCKAKKLNFPKTWIIWEEYFKFQIIPQPLLTPKFQPCETLSSKHGFLCLDLRHTKLWDNKLLAISLKKKKKKKKKTTSNTWWRFCRLLRGCAPTWFLSLLALLFSISKMLIIFLAFSIPHRLRLLELTNETTSCPVKFEFWINEYFFFSRNISQILERTDLYSEGICCLFEIWMWGGLMHLSGNLTRNSASSWLCGEESPASTGDVG